MSQNHFHYTKVTGAKKYDLQSIKIKNNCISEITVSPENDTGGITVKNYGNAQKSVILLLFQLPDKTYIYLPLNHPLISILFRMPIFNEVSGSSGSSWQ